ncbi:hypothetical protein JXB27_04430 [Candidatus Woesearchaeota archaeon]|nr:hypothetical protein [Candidatus Woesearchaeota archaeon]
MALTRPEEAVKVLENVVRENSGNFGMIARALEHFVATGNRAKDIAQVLSTRMDGKGENFQNELEIAGYFHDVGRCFAKDKKDHAFHEIYGANWFEQNAVALGITDSQEQANRMAQYLRPHFIVKEQFEMPEYDVWKKGLEGTDVNLLLPKSWNELVIIYADLTNNGGKIISFEERVADIKKRDKETGNMRLKALETAETRLLKYKNDVELALKQGVCNGGYLLK